MTMIIGFIGGPGAGKDTLASGLFHEIKKLNIDAFLANEWIKPYAYMGIMPDPVTIFKEQLFIEKAAENNTDFIISTSPSILAIYYKNTSDEDDIKYVLNKWKQEDHKLYFIKRSKPYIKKGRYQTEDRAREMDIEIKSFLIENKIPFKDLDYQENTIPLLLKEILK